jgi:hypothetical protein
MTGELEFDNPSHREEVFNTPIFLSRGRLRPRTKFLFYFPHDSIKVMLCFT